MDTDFPSTDDMARKEHRILSGEDMLGMQFHDLSTMGQQQRQHHVNMHHHNMIPPTPSSIDLQTGLPHSYMHSMEADLMMNRFNSMRDDQILFTPLVSPAVTPLDTNFIQHIPSFTMPEYFSPLTSPALDAHQHRTHMTNPHMIHAQSTSPIDPKDSPTINRKINPSRRKSTTSRNPARVVRESPSMKPQRKKAPPPLAPTLELTAAFIQQPSTPDSRQTPQKQDFPSSLDTSSNESVSPEPLPDVLMPPPPRAPQSPMIAEGDGRASGAPATPASLMKLQKTNLPTEDIPPIAMDTSEFLNGDVERVMKDVGTKDEISKSHDEQRSAPTAKIGSSGSNMKVGEQWRSPMIGAQALASSSSGKGRMVKPSSRSGKRGSVCSSPALQPRISPSIKPLLPQGMGPETSALLLKSNYQNIVEGTHKQLGLSYPAELSTNLTSKRTSHKIAEQGRRNRINNALAEIAALLPQTSGNGSDGSTSAAASAAAAQASKASTVESAIEFIKELQRELSETKGKLAEAERQLAKTNLAE
ncbi:hypothetical protein Q9L58_001798 [Maublancomyces gigas]|uniref:BHLH domain-containing protein n=1 Tax=Discina gigas TaxID=1032678 RepID=A0ABR3GTI2_9PEZI